MACRNDISPWVAQYAHLVGAGDRVLDLAAGSGRHTRFFADRGLDVLAVDADISGMTDLAGRPSVELIQTDLEDGSPWPFADERFAAVVVCNYLHRPTLPRLSGLLTDGAVLIYETFAVGQEEIGRPRSPDFLLRPNELIDTVADALTVIGYEHGLDTGPPRAVRQRLCAVTTPTPVALRG